MVCACMHIHSDIEYCQEHSKTVFFPFLFFPKKKYLSIMDLTVFDIWLPNATYFIFQGGHVFLCQYLWVNWSILLPYLYSIFGSMFNEVYFYLLIVAVEHYLCNFFFTAVFDREMQNSHLLSCLKVLCGCTQIQNRPIHGIFK